MRLRISYRVELRAGQIAQPFPFDQIVNERVEGRLGDALVSAQIPARIEIGIGIQACAGAVAQEMHQRICTGGNQRGIFRAVLLYVEVLRRIAEFRSAVEDVVFKRVLSGFGDIRVADRYHCVWKEDEGPVSLPLPTGSVPADPIEGKGPAPAGDTMRHRTGRAAWRGFSMIRRMRHGFRVVVRCPMAGAPFGLSKKQIVGKGTLGPKRGVRVVTDVPGRVEFRAGPEASALAVVDVVAQRVSVGRSCFRVMLDVPLRIEVWVGLMASLGAVLDEMQQRIGPGLAPR